MFLYICAIIPKDIEDMRFNYKTFFLVAALIGGLTLTSCGSSRKAGASSYALTRTEGSMIDINAQWDAHPDADAVALLQPYKKKIDDMMYEVIGTSDQLMDKGKPESLLSNLVAEVLRQAAVRVQDTPADMGLVNMGGIRNILPAGPIQVGTVFEILPFENSLCVLTMKGKYLKSLLTSIASLRGEGVSGVRLEITPTGQLLSATIGGQPIEDEKLYTVATIDYLADGNGSMDAFLQAEKRVCPEEATLRGLFLEYVRQQTAAGKTITSALDSRITLTPNEQNQ